MFFKAHLDEMAESATVPMRTSVSRRGSSQRRPPSWKQKAGEKGRPCQLCVQLQRSWVQMYDTIKTAAEITRPVRAETRCSARLLSVALSNTAPYEVRYIALGKLINIYNCWCHGF